MDTLIYFSFLVVFTQTVVATPVPTVAPTPYNIKTVVGTGSVTSSGTGGLATLAGVNGPRVVVQDSTGLIYFNEGFASCVRKISSSNIVSLYAGTCSTDGYGGDNGPATSSLIWFPVGMVFDSVGNLYISDFKNFRTRYVSTAGIISTVAGTGVQATTGIGGQATSAQLNAPHGMWISSTNQVYITLFQDGSIKTFTKGGTIQAVGGTGISGYSVDNIPATSAQFAGMEVIIGDSTGQLYVADSGNHRVRQITTAGIVSTIAGWGDTTYNGENVKATAAGIFYPCGIVIDTSSNDLYMNARGNNRLHVSTKSTGLVTTFAGTGTATSAGFNGAATAASFNANDGLYIDTSTGQLYVTEFVGDYVRKIYSVAPTVIPTVQPSRLPSVQPSLTPTVIPSLTPTLTPTLLPSLLPSLAPSVSPTIQPTVLPSAAPSLLPSLLPTVLPSIAPSLLPSVSPTVAPSAAPSVAPSVVPSVIPSIAPSLLPSVLPSISPSESPTLIPSRIPTQLPSLIPTVKPSLSVLPIRDSPSFKVSNSLASVGITSTGGVLTWGAACCGGDSSSVSGLLGSLVKQVVQSKNAFAALKSDGSVVAWGSGDDIAGSTVFRSYTTITSLVATERAFAGVTSAGGVIAFGAGCCGGNVDQYGWAQYLNSGVSSIRANGGAVCALKTDGTVYCWGSKFTGGGVSSLTRSDLSGIVLLSSTKSAFAGMTSDGSVVVWGNKYFGGTLSTERVALLTSNTLHLLSNAVSFAAYTRDETLEVWGGFEGSSAGGFKYVASTATAFAALRSNGTVSVKGDSTSGGDASDVDLSSVSVVVGNTGAFAAITSGGAVIAWGESESGGRLFANVSSTIGSGVTTIYHTSKAFAVLNSAGAVTAWGKATSGGSVASSIATSVSSGVKMLCANDNGFTAIKNDGTAFVWGCASCHLDFGLLSGDYSTVVSC